MAGETRTTIALAFAGSMLAATVAAQPTQQQRGEYLAQAGDCLSCHTKPGGPAYAGGLRMKTPVGNSVAPKTLMPLACARLMTCW